MSIAIHIQTVVLPGHKIEVQVPELPEGRKATVFVVLEEEEVPQMPIFERLANYPGKQLFKTAEEVDAYLREERDSWDR
jgi:hypothetical protein